MKQPLRPSAAPANSAKFERVAKEATTARKANNTAQAILLYQKALQLNPRWDEGWWYVGILYYDSDKYPQGAQAFQNLVQLTPNSGAAWGFLGLCEFEMKEYKNAFIHLERSQLLGLGDNQELIHAIKLHQSLIEILGGNFEDAKSLLSSLVVGEVVGNDVNMALGLALLHVPLLPDRIAPAKVAIVRAAGKIGELEALEDFGAAKKACQQLVHDYPTTPFVHYLYGVLLAELSEYQEAKQELQEEVRINGESSAPYINLAYIAVHIGRFQEALPPARQAVRLAPQSFAAHYLLGRALLGLGQVNESILELSAAKRLGPNHPGVHYNLAQALARANRPREAVEEQAEFMRLNVLVQRSKQQSRPPSHRESKGSGEALPLQIRKPAGGAAPR